MADTETLVPVGQREPEMILDLLSRLSVGPLYRLQSFRLSNLHSNPDDIPFGNGVLRENESTQSASHG
jgi:hypothetical protein